MVEAFLMAVFFFGMVISIAGIYNAFVVIRILKRASSEFAQAVTGIMSHLVLVKVLSLLIPISMIIALAFSTLTASITVPLGAIYFVFTVFSVRALIVNTHKIEELAHYLGEE